MKNKSCPYNDIIEDLYIHLLCRRQCISELDTEAIIFVHEEFRKNFNTDIKTICESIQNTEPIKLDSDDKSLEDVINFILKAQSKLKNDLDYGKKILDIYQNKIKPYLL